MVVGKEVLKTKRKGETVIKMKSCRVALKTKMLTRTDFVQRLGVACDEM